MERRALPLLILGSRDPSVGVAGTSKVAGVSSLLSDRGRGALLTGEVGVTVVTGGMGEQVEVKGGGNSLSPGLLGEGRREQGDKARLACSFSIRAEFLLVLAGCRDGEMGFSSSTCPCAVVLGSCRVRGGRLLTGLLLPSVPVGKGGA